MHRSKDLVVLIVGDRKARFLFAQANDSFWELVVSKLAETQNFEICAWISKSPNQWIRENFPEAVSWDFFDAVRGIPPNTDAECKEIPLDGEILAKYVEVESVVLKMMDRMDGGRFSYNARIGHYHHLLAFWLAFVKSRRPTIVVFHTVPHMIFDYILYKICELEGIRIICFERISIRGYIYLIDSIDQGSIGIKNKYSEALSEKQQLVFRDPSLPVYLSKLRTDKTDASAVHFKHRKVKYLNQLGSINQSLKFLDIVLAEVPLIIRELTKLVLGKFTGGYLTSGLKSPAAARLTGLGLLVSDRWRGRMAKYTLKYRYDRLATLNAVPGCKFVFFGLSYQPEQNTSPMAGQFVHQYLAIRLLAMAVPDDWIIVVKEHPLAFVQNRRGHQGRAHGYYEQILCNRKVVFAHMGVNSFDLIDQAVCVATTTGTVGWESVVRQKPVLIFGSPWYRYCAGVFSVKTLEDLLVALHKIQAGFQVSVEEVDTYLKVVTDASIRAYNDNKQAASSGISESQAVQEIAHCLEDQILRL